MSAEALNDSLVYERIGDDPDANPSRFRFRLKDDLGVADSDGLRRNELRLKVNNLRKLMLSRLDGVAVRAFSVSIDVGGKVDTAPHKYYALDNLREDMPSLIRNLRRITLNGARDLQDGDLVLEREIVLDEGLRDEKGNPIMERKISCADFNDALQSKMPSATFVNDEYIATLVRERGDQEVRLTLRLLLDERTGFVEAGKNREDADPLTVIPIDSQHSPVIRCAMHEDDAAENVIVEIETNGAISPDEAVKEALARLQYQHVFLEG